MLKIKKFLYFPKDRKKLTKAEKAKRRTHYKLIKKKWSKVEDKQGLSEKGFRERVIAEMIANNISVKEAIRKTLFSETFTTKAERSRHNLKEAIKRLNPALYRDIIKNRARDIKGHFVKFSESLTWNRDLGGYTYVDTEGHTFLIDVTNSPEEITVTQVN